MLASALDVRPVPLGGRVVDGEDQRRARPIAREPLKEDAEQDPGDRQGLASDAAEQVVIALVVAPCATARSQLATVRRPRAKSSPVQSATNRTCWRASSVPAKAVIQTTSETGSHCVSIHGSPSHESVAYPTTACGESRLIWKGRVTPGTPDELPDFWESAGQFKALAFSDAAQAAGGRADVISRLGGRGLGRGGSGYRGQRRSPWR